MFSEHRSSDWDSYKIDYHNPHVPVEPLEQEVMIVGETLNSLVAAGILPHTNYDHDKLLAHRQAVAELFEIPWTAITPRVQRLLYAINAIKQPQVMIAAGVFCGNTFISNAGAAVGPGTCYLAKDLVGVEIKPEEAERAERNVRRIDPSGVARVVAADAVDIVCHYPEAIEVLYLDADGDEARGKGIYLDILQTAWDKLPEGSIILAHNSVNCAERLQHYLAWVRDSINCRASVNVIIDSEGVEVSVK